MTPSRYPPTLPANVTHLADVLKREASGPSGPMTVRAGEKGVVLRSADGKRVLGQLGTMPDGSMSLSVDVAGAVQDIRNPINEAEARITYLDGQRRDHDSRITANRSSITYLDSERRSMQASLNDHESRISANRSSVTWLDNNKASNSAVSRAQSAADAAQSTANSAWSKADSAQDTGASALSRAAQGIASAGSAMARANSAYSLAEAAWNRANK